jgi:hypothetical protein
MLRKKPPSPPQALLRTTQETPEARLHSTAVVAALHQHHLVLCLRTTPLASFINRETQLPFLFLGYLFLQNMLESGVFF